MSDKSNNSGRLVLLVAADGCRGIYGPMCDGVQREWITELQGGGRRVYEFEAHSGQRLITGHERIPSEFAGLVHEEHKKLPWALYREKVVNGADKVTA